MRFDMHETTSPAAKRGRPAFHVRSDRLPIAAPGVGLRIHVFFCGASLVYAFNIFFIPFRILEPIGCYKRTDQMN